MSAGPRIVFGRRLMEERIVAGITRAQMAERLIAGLSRQDVASRLGTSVTALEEYELGEQRIPVAVLAEACRVLGLRVSTLVHERFRPASVRRASGRAPRWVGVARPPSVLGHANFARLRPLVREWQARHGEWTSEVQRILASTKLLPRTYRTSFGPTLNTRYDRVLFPWRGGADEFIVGVSLRREMPRVGRRHSPLEPAS